MYVIWTLRIERDVQRRLTERVETERHEHARLRERLEHIDLRLSMLQERLDQQRVDLIAWERESIALRRIAERLTDRELVRNHGESAQHPKVTKIDAWSASTGRTRYERV